ncbi:MAG TPA: tripartite tricarboxylate transporter substrate binding protein [Burkholderiales bacterium]|jgi:tripartite-type tricarboxylate transporter receptor subunit TctC|nr:tripartite tricarboxylate transporter substrate binding protein [Burkholderiales bacterium]
MFRLLLASLVALFASQAAAQGFPSKPVRLIVPFPAGGGSDVVGRIVALKLSDVLGQQVVVDNRPGAGGSIGTEAAVRAAPDGYTMVLASTSEIAVNPAIYSKLSYDTLKDLAPVGMVATTPMVLIVAPQLPVKTVSDFVALAKAKGTQLNVASAGNGSFTHLAGEFFRSLAGLKWTHVPYKGAPPAITDLAAGRADAMFSTLPAAMSFIRSNLVKPVAVSSPARVTTLDVPTVVESGVPYEAEYWYGIFVPSATPKDVVARLSQALGQTLAAQETVDNLAKQGASPARIAPDQFEAYVRTEHAKWGKVARDSGARVD